MAIYEFEGNRPVIGKSTYVHPTASVIGNVLIKDKCFVGPGAVIRADYGKVTIGMGCAIEDNCIIHSEPDTIVIMENNILLGHGAIVHGPCLIKNKSIIGMGSVVSSGCEIGPYGFLGAGSVLIHGHHIPEKTMAAGNPAKIKKPLDEKLLTYIKLGTSLYEELGDRYLKGIKLIED